MIPLVSLHKALTPPTLNNVDTSIQSQILAKSLTAAKQSAKTLEVPETEFNKTLEVPETEFNKTLEVPETEFNKTLEVPETEFNKTLEVPETKRLKIDTKRLMNVFIDAAFSQLNLKF